MSVSSSHRTMNSSMEAWKQLDRKVNRVKIIVTKNTICLQAEWRGVCTVKVIHMEPTHNQKEGTELQVHCCCESLSSRCLNSINLFIFMMHLISHSPTDFYFSYIYIEHLGIDLCCSWPQISEDNYDTASYTTLQTPELVSTPSFLFLSISSWNISSYSRVCVFLFLPCRISHIYS